MDISNSEITPIPIIGGPSGIGDLSWMYSKLVHVGPLRWEVADGHPPRSKGFLEMLPNVVSAEFSPDFRYDDIIAFEQIHGWMKPGVKWEDISRNGFGRYLLEANRHLEQGRRLETWLPDLPTDFHYEMRIGEEAEKKAAEMLEDIPGPICLVNCASERGAEAWKTWKRQEWVPFLHRVEAEGVTPVLIGGFWDDLTSDVADEGGFANLVGRTRTEVFAAMLRVVPFYIGFSSGLGILRTVLKRKSFMLWPDHQLLLSTSWAPLEMLEEGTYIASLWRDPDLVFGNVKRWLKR